MRGGLGGRRHGRSAGQGPTHGGIALALRRPSTASRPAVVQAMTVDKGMFLSATSQAAR